MNTRDWYAWINLMPPKPDDFHVVGEVFVSNPVFKPNSASRSLKASTPKHPVSGFTPDPAARYVATGDDVDSSTVR